MLACRGGHDELMLPIAVPSWIQVWWPMLMMVLPLAVLMCVLPLAVLTWVFETMVQQGVRLE